MVLIECTQFMLMVLTTHNFISEMRIMMAESKMERKTQIHKLLTDGTCSNIQDALTTYHYNEERHLLKTSNSLMEFIKYVNRDNSNASIISDIVKSILALKDSM